MIGLFVELCFFFVSGDLVFFLDDGGWCSFFWGVGGSVCFCWGGY